MKRPLCPILLIGFPAPEEGKRDLRRCNPECAWYDDNLDQCMLKTMTTNLEDINTVVSDYFELFLDMNAGIYDDENYEFDANAKDQGFWLCDFSYFKRYKKGETSLWQK